MAFEVFNADGELVEGVLPPEEIKTLQEQLEETNQKLSKLEKKDFDYKRLENLTEAEKEKLSAVELELKKKAEELEDKQKQFSNTFISEVKNDLLESLVGDDEELRKKVAFNFERIKDSEKAQSREEIKSLLRDAYAMSVGSNVRNPLNIANNKVGSGDSFVNKKIDGDLAELSKKMGISQEDLEKYGK